jgi:hypothetical protein
MKRAVCTLVAAFLVASLALPGAALAGRHGGPPEKASLLKGGPSPKQPRKVEQGVVQSAGAGTIVLRELDGSIVAIAVVPQTQIVLNKQPATLADIQPGFVAIVLHFGSGPAVAISAIGIVKPTRDRGVIQSVGASSFVLSTASGPVTINVGQATALLLNGRPAGIADLRAGDLAEAAHVGANPAIEIRAFGRRGR